MAWWHRRIAPSVNVERVVASTVAVLTTVERLERLEQRVDDLIIIVRRLEDAIAIVNVRQTHALVGRLTGKTIRLVPVHD